MIISEVELKALLHANHSQPHVLLGMHPVYEKKRRGVVVRTLIKGARSCEVIDLEAKPERRFKLEKLDDAGFFEGFIADTDGFRYRLRVEQANGEIRQFYDPYAFAPTLGDQDLYLFGEGKEHRIYTKLGAHIRELDGVPGVSFAVWAPSARRVSIVGDFNQWDGRYHPMRSMGASGVWEVFIPGLGAGMKYKFEILGQDGFLRLKTDPYGFAFEAPPHNASITHKLGNYDWLDNEWLTARPQHDWKAEPMNIYEVHLGSWKHVVEDGSRPLSYREIAVDLANYCNEHGFNFVEFMPVAEFPFAGSWGYQVTGFYAPTHRYGTPDDFKYLVDTLHQHKIGVIVDWVPGHFPRDSFALAEFDGSCLYEHADPRQGHHMDWGTLIFNYGRHEVRNFLVGNALFWIDEYHIDGLRVDAVASMLYLDYSREDGQWVPNQYGGRENIEAIEFLRETNKLVHEYYPGTVTIAEESTAFGGVSKPVEEHGLGFDFKWNMGWMHDTLQYFQKDPIHRKYHHNDITFGMVYQYSEAFIEVFSHDEVVHGKGSMINKMAAWEMSAKAANLRALYGLMWMWPGKNTLFMGCEFGQSSEWRYDGSLDWHLLQYTDHSGILDLVGDLNRLVASAPAIYENDFDHKGFQWINLNDYENSCLTFLRKGNEPTDTYLVACNFCPVKRTGYRVGAPYAGYWKELLNTDSDIYGGSGAGNNGGLSTGKEESDGQPFSLTLTLPPMSVTVFRYTGSGNR